MAVSELNRIGAIEAGGTKVVCAVGRTWSEVRDAPSFVVDTTSPTETAAKVMNWLRARHEEDPLSAIGVGSFGPVDFATKSIAATTPKVAWRNFSWHDVIREHLADLPIGFDTDTNAAALAEWRWGAATNKRIVAYVTIGTGIGGGLLIEGVPVRGLMHPEVGHMFVPRSQNDNFLGNCPSHGDCLEGLASGPAVEERWGHTGAHLPPDHPAWDLESDYLSLAAVNIITTISPEVVVLGGGVMAVPGLLEKVRAKTVLRLAGYISNDVFGPRINEYLVPPGLGPFSGVIGAYALGVAAHKTRHVM